MYGGFLAGSNFLAPILAGFINDGQGWKWVLVKPLTFANRLRADTVQYWCAILCAAGFVFLFFFMEETNYHRAESKATNKTKSYSSKLKVFDTETLRYPNHLKGMVFRPLIFLSFPVIFFSGFSYGSNLIWFNVLNGTASLILSESPYEFSSSIVGLCYFSPLIGVILG